MEEIENNQNEKELQPEVLFKKVEEIQKIRERGAKEEKRHLEDVGLERTVDEITKELPDDVKEEIFDKIVKKLKEKNILDEDVLDIVRPYAEKSMLLYKDNREAINMFNRLYAHHHLKDAIDKIMRDKDVDFPGLLKVGRIDMDMDGLTALNQYGGHQAGDMGLKAFTDILKNGETTKWLEGLGFKIIPTAEGGDEFGIVIYDDQNLLEKQGINGEEKSLIEEIQDRYHEEINSVDASGFIDFNSKVVRDELEKDGIKVGADFKYEIGTSVGAAVFGEALSRIEVKEGDDYDKIIEKISGKLLDISDTRAVSRKKKDRRELRKTDPLLAELYDKPSEEKVRLRKENEALRARITELEDQLKYSETMGNLKNI